MASDASAPRNNTNVNRSSWKLPPYWPKPLKPTSFTNPKSGRVESCHFPASGADYCLVSSDEVAFGFTEAQFTQSSVFTDMVAAGASKTDIPLVDDEIETSKEIEFLLGLLSGDDVRPSGLLALPGIILLAKKYEFPPIYTKCIQTASAREAIELFCLAARMDDESLASEAVNILEYKTGLLSDYSSYIGLDIEKQRDSNGQMAAVHTLLDFSSWPVDAIQGLPTVYTWALGRAARPTVYRTPHYGYRLFYDTNVPKRFKHFLAIAKSGVPTERIGLH